MRNPVTAKTNVFLNPWPSQRRRARFTWQRFNRSFQASCGDLVPAGTAMLVHDHPVVGVTTYCPRCGERRMELGGAAEPSI